MSDQTYFDAVYLADLSEQLRDDAVAFTNPDLARDQSVQEQIHNSLRPGDGIAVVDVANQPTGWARDVATKLQEATGLDTVIVQQPAGVSAVSDSWSRAEIEAAQAQTTPGQSQVDMLRTFYDALPAGDLAWGLIIPLVLAVCAVTFWAAYRMGARR